VALDRQGRVQGLEMWEHRRYVVTGALLGHWAEQFGLAPIDVIVGRFAQAFCCLSSLAPVAPPDLASFAALDPQRAKRVHVGTEGSIIEFAGANKASVRWTSLTELTRRAVSSFVASDQGKALEVLAARVDGGSSLGVLVAREEVAQAPVVAYARVREDVVSLLRRGELRVQERGRKPVADFALALLADDATLDALLADAPEATRKVADAFRKAGGRAVDLVENGSAAVLERLGARDETAGAGAEDLVERAEIALDRLVSATVKITGPKLDRSTFGDAALQKKLGAELARQALPKLREDAVQRAALAAVRE
jgi:hypothetical protein